jgi:hypothetical protein
VSNFSRSHAVPLAFADYDHDGRVDAVAARTDGSRLQLWHNETEMGDNHWLHVRIPDDGNGEVGGIGARIVVKAGSLVLWRDMHGGKSRAAQNAHEIRFGLGSWDGVEWVAALWPDGRQTALVGVQADQTVELPAPAQP